MGTNGMLHFTRYAAVAVCTLVLVGFGASTSRADGSGGSAYEGSGTISGGAGAGDPAGETASDKHGTAVSIMRFALDTPVEPGPAGVSAQFTSAVGPIGIMTDSRSAASGKSGTGGDACPSGQIRCDRWLQEQHRKILLKLMATYYALGTGRNDAAPHQAEVIANLVANVISSK